MAFAPFLVSWERCVSSWLLWMSVLHKVLSFEAAMEFFVKWQIMNPLRWSVSRLEMLTLGSRVHWWRRRSSKRAVSVAEQAAMAKRPAGFATEAHDVQQMVGQEASAKAFAKLWANRPEKDIDTEERPTRPTFSLETRYAVVEGAHGRKMKPPRFRSRVPFSCVGACCSSTSRHEMGIVMDLDTTCHARSPTIQAACSLSP